MEAKKTFSIYEIKTKPQKHCEPWKSGNPKAGFPLFHRPEPPAAQGKELPFTQIT